MTVNKALQFVPIIFVFFLFFEARSEQRQLGEIKDEAWIVHPQKNEKEIEDEDEMLWMLQSAQNYWSGKTRLSEDDIEKFENIYLNSTIDNRIYAFDVLVTAQDVEKWKHKFEELLESQNAAEVTTSLQIFNLTLRKGEKRTKIVLSNLPRIEEKLETIKIKFSENKNILSRIEKIEENYIKFVGLQTTRNTDQTRNLEKKVTTKTSETSSAQEEVVLTEVNQRKANQIILPWWMLGIGSFVIVLGFMVLKGKSK